MEQFKLVVNGKPRTVDADPSTPLLWVIRDHLGLKGTKYGCGIAQCGACTVHVNGRAVRSCAVTIASAAGQRILTIEGLAAARMHPLQMAWTDEKVPQCGYCQPGQIMQAADLLSRHPDPTEKQIVQAMSGNLCRCGTYQRIRRAIRRAAAQHKRGS